ncbi:MAG: glycosyltransferase family A protein [Actinomycetota bacterium]
MACTVSIGLPVYNGADYLDGALESILGQTYADLEVVICDNASTDATEEICRRHAARDARVRYHRQPANQGAAKNYNDTFELSSGRYFKWAAHDDLLEPGFVEACVTTLDAAPESVVLAYPRAVVIDEDGERLRVHEELMDIREQRPIQRLLHVVNRWGLCNPVFGLMRRDALQSTGLIRPYVSSDVSLLAELALLGEFWEIEDPLFLRRVHHHSSRGGHLSLTEVARWFDPNASGPRFLHPRTRLFFHVLSVVWRSPSPLGERIACVAAVTPAWWFRRLRIRQGQFRRWAWARLTRR